MVLISTTIGIGVVNAFFLPWPTEQAIGGLDGKKLFL
jgi:hypothetical protein